MAETNETSTSVAYQASLRTLTQSYDVMLTESVALAYDYAGLLNDLEDLPKEVSEVNIRLAGYGGYLDGGLPLYNAIKKCKVPVHTRVVSSCYSMTSIIALAGTTLTLEPGTVLMFHNYGGGEQERGQALLDAIIHTNDVIWEFFDRALQPFLTLEEVKRIKADGTIYVKAYDKDLKKRITRHFGGAKK